MNDPVEQFWRDWSRDAAVARLCVCLFQYLSDHSNHLEHFNFSQLKDATQSHDDVRLTQALQYLSSPKWKILTQAFLFFDDDQVYEFEAAEMAEYFAAGKFPHPRTGHAIKNLDLISVAFEPGQFFRQAG